MKAVAQGLYKLKAVACKGEKKGGFIGNSETDSEYKLL